MKNYFTTNELACKCGCGLSKVDPTLIKILNAVREELGIPLIINSGTRCIKHNESSNVNGVKESAHLVQKEDGYSKAVDIKVLWDVTRAKIYNSLLKHSITRFEVSDKHLHFDILIDDKHPTPLLRAIFFGD